MKNTVENVKKTLYIPLYGKAFVSRKRLFLRDEKAEEIWERVAFPLKRKARSKWLAYYMGIRSAVFDEWVRARLNENVTVLHLGCGLDSRILRVKGKYAVWYDVDFPEVIAERRRYFTESDNYRMMEGDVRHKGWLSAVSDGKKAVVLMEGISMYLSWEELESVIAAVCARFDEVELLMDVYTPFAAKMSRIKNPVNDVGVTVLHGIGDPTLLAKSGLRFDGELEMTPQKHIDELKGAEKHIFRTLYAGKTSRKLYKLYAYKK